jgi:hypothetical protein
VLKIGRVYFDACGYHDGVLEEIVLNALDEAGNASPHLLHAPNGVGKTTILSLLFSVFEPNRRKFLRTEMNHQHHLEHYFLPGRLGVVAIELIRDLPRRGVTRYVIGQLFWMTSASQGEEGEPGQRRLFAFESQDELTFDTLPFRRLGGGAVLKTLEDVARWVRQLRLSHPATFYSTSKHVEWAKYLTAEIGIDLRLIAVQRKFCAAEGGISSAFLNFKNEQEFLEKIFYFMIPEETSESVIASIGAGLAKIRDLPKRRDQFKALKQLREAFQPFVTEAESLDAAEATLRTDHRSLGGIYVRLRRELATLEIERNDVRAELDATMSAVAQQYQRDRQLEAEALFLENTSAEKRVAEAKVALEHAHGAARGAGKRTRAARAADVERRFNSAKQLRDELQAELDRIEQDLKPDRARLARAGGVIHALLEHCALEAQFDAQAETARANAADAEAERKSDEEKEALGDKLNMASEISRLEHQVQQHAKERAELLVQGVLRETDTPAVAIQRFSQELTQQRDLDAEAELRDETLQQQAVDIEGTRQRAEQQAQSSAEDRDRLDARVVEGEKLELTILACTYLPAILAGEARDVYRADLPDRVHGAYQACEESFRRESTEREQLADELRFLESSGVSSVPQDVRELARTLADAGFADALPAEHYLAEFVTDTERSLGLIRSDPARFTGVFVAKPDAQIFSAMARDGRLRLKGPVMVSAPTLDVTPSSQTSSFVFGPLSASRFNKLAAEQERAQLVDLLEKRDNRLCELSAELNELTALETDVRRAQREFGARRPSELADDRDAAERRRQEAVQTAASATTSLGQIKDDRLQLKLLRNTYMGVIARATSCRQTLEGFAERYASIEEVTDRLKALRDLFACHEARAAAAREAARVARERSKAHASSAAALDAKASNWRSQKQHYPETDGQPASPTGTLKDLIVVYRTAEAALHSKREAQSAGVSLRLSDIKTTVLELSSELTTAQKDLSDGDIAAFRDVVDLDRAIAEATQRETACLGEIPRADSALETASGRTGPIAKKLKDASERSVPAIVLREFLQASPDECDAARAVREQARESCRAQLRILSEKDSELRAKESTLSSGVSALSGSLERAQDHLPESYRNELPDLSLSINELPSALSNLVDRLKNSNAAIAIARSKAENAFARVRQIVGAELFRQLEPRVAEHLVRYDSATASAERVVLMTRIDERIAIVTSEVENQQRDQSTCLQQLSQHVAHADDLLRRAVRCSKIPEDAFSYAGQRMLTMTRALRDVPPDAAMNQLSIWLDEQAANGRVPADGAKLAAELLNRVHSGRSLEIKILKPKRDAIRPYMPVESIGVSGGEGVTVAMMLYTVIQKMAVDERADTSGSGSGGFLLLDNPYGASNLLEHVTLQMSLAKTLGIQLFVATCVEDKNVLNLFPTLSRLVQAERVLRNGVPQYVRVRSADFVFKGSSDAA